MRISTIAKPLADVPTLMDLKLGSSAYVALPVQFELTAKEKDNPKVTPVRALYICLPDSRQARAIARFAKDSQCKDNPPLGLKLNCFAEVTEAYRFQNYSGPKADDPDPTATETWYRTMSEKFTIYGTDKQEVYDLILMNGEVDVLPLGSWGNRTLVTCDNTKLTKFVSNKGNDCIRITSEQFSLITKKPVWHNLLMYTQGPLVTSTVDKLSDKSIVALEGRLQRQDGDLVVLGDAVIPIKLLNNGLEVIDNGAADSTDPAVRSNTYNQQQQFSSNEDY